MKQPFSFPDDAFPSIPQSFPGLPPSPLEKIKKIENGYHTLVRQVSGGPDIEADMASSTSSASSLTRRLSQNIQAANEDLDGHPYNKKIDVDRMFKWARETVDFAENQFGLAPEIVNAACDIIVLVSESESGLTKFKGAAQYIIGVWHRFGLFNRPSNSKKALEYFYASAKSGFPRALYRIGTEYESSGDTAAALQYFSQGVKKGDSACLYRMSMCYLRGHLGIEINVEKGREYLQKASSTSDPDSSQSSYVFGLIQLNELSNLAPPDPSIPYSAAIQAIERSAWVGFAPALLRMGMAWQGGEKGYDSAIALRYFHIVSRQEQYMRYKGDPTTGHGVAEAEISKWMLCGSVDRFPPNEEMAFYFAKLASEQENGLAEFAVGYFYEVGIYVEQDIKAALIWYGIAASHENKDAVDRLKALNVNRSNTITKLQHHRTLTTKGRGSIKSFKKKLESQPKQHQQYPDLSSSDGTPRSESPTKHLRLSRLFSKSDDNVIPEVEGLSLNDQSQRQGYQNTTYQNQNYNHHYTEPPVQLSYSHVQEPIANPRPRRTRHSFPLTSSIASAPQDEDPLKNSTSSSSSGRNSPYLNGHPDISATNTPVLYPMEGPRRRSSPISRTTPSLGASVNEASFRSSQNSHYIPRKTPSFPPSQPTHNQSHTLSSSYNSLSADNLNGTSQGSHGLDFDSVSNIQKEGAPESPSKQIDKKPSLESEKKESDAVETPKKGIVSNVFGYLWGGNGNNESEKKTEPDGTVTSPTPSKDDAKKSEDTPSPPQSRESHGPLPNRPPVKVNTLPTVSESNAGRYRPGINTPSDENLASLPHSKSASTLSSTASISLPPPPFGSVNHMRRNTPSPTRQLQPGHYRTGSDIGSSVVRPQTASSFASTNLESDIFSNNTAGVSRPSSAYNSPRSVSPGKRVMHPRNPNVLVVQALPGTGRGPKTFEEMEIPAAKSKEDCVIM